MAGTFSWGTWSSNGNVTTTSINQVFTFDGLSLNSLSVQAINNAVTIKVNDESYTHSIASGNSIIFDNMRVYKLTILENGVTVKMAGTHE